VTFQRVVDDVFFAPNTPFVEWLMRVIQDFVPLAVPFQFLSFFPPKTFKILFGGSGQRVPVFQTCLVDHILGWIVYLPA
jgi:hypothetical protein